MIVKKIAGIMRAGAYSPNHIGNDAAIFNAVADILRASGLEVTIYNEQQLIDGEVTENVIINMCREHESIMKLQQLENSGRIVINSGYGIDNCTREKLTNLFITNNIPYPDSIIVDTNADVKEQLQAAGYSSAWIKRGDFHAMHKEDVSYVRHAEEAQEVLSEYSMRGIKRAVINQHLIGDLIKFYGVQGTPFFYWFYPLDIAHSKFGHEAINGKAKGLTFNVDELHTICEEASVLTNVKIYGGDCIVSPDGDVRIIDYNDWPSFAPCRNEAATYIAACIIKTIEQHD